MLSHKLGGYVFIVPTIILRLILFLLANIKSKAIVSKFCDDIGDSREFQWSLHNDILTFDVTVNDSLLVQVLNRFDDLDGDQTKSKLAILQSQLVFFNLIQL
jgi:hypothetical protein